MAAVLCFATLAGCEKNEQPKGTVNSSLVGEWALESWNGEEVNDFVIYIKLRDDSRFELYQQLSTSYYEYFDGIYDAANNMLTGVYSDGEPWNDSYGYKLDASGNRLTLTSQQASQSEYVYVRTQIPSDIIVGGGSRSETSKRPL